MGFLYRLTDFWKRFKMCGRTCQGWTGTQKSVFLWIAVRHRSKVNFGSKETSATVPCIGSGIARTRKNRYSPYLHNNLVINWLEFLTRLSLCLFNEYCKVWQHSSANWVLIDGLSSQQINQIYGPPFSLFFEKKLNHTEIFMILTLNLRYIASIISARHLFNQVDWQLRLIRNLSPFGPIKCH